MTEQRSSVITEGSLADYSLPLRERQPAHWNSLGGHLRLSSVIMIRTFYDAALQLASMGLVWTKVARRGHGLWVETQLQFQTKALSSNEVCWTSLCLLGLCFVFYWPGHFLASIRSKWAGELSSTHPASGSLFPYYSVFLEILLTKLLNNVSIQLFSYWVSFGKMKSISMF